MNRTWASLSRIDERLDVVVDDADLERRGVDCDQVSSRCRRGQQVNGAGRARHQMLVPQNTQLVLARCQGSVDCLTCIGVSSTISMYYRLRSVVPPW